VIPVDEVTEVNEKLSTAITSAMSFRNAGSQCPHDFFDAINAGFIMLSQLFIWTRSNCEAVLHLGGLGLLGGHVLRRIP
jgi:hypothetical protein